MKKIRLDFCDFWAGFRKTENFFYKFFNSKSFLNYDDFATEEALIQRIIQLDQQDSLYEQYLAEPYFVDDLPNDFFSEERLLAQFDRIFTQKIRPVSQKSSFFTFGRWIFVRRCRPHGPSLNYRS